MRKCQFHFPSFITLLFLISCSSSTNNSNVKENTTVVKDSTDTVLSKHEYRFEHGISDHDFVEDINTFYQNTDYNIDKYLIPISQNEYLKDSTTYHNTLKTTDSFRNNYLNTSYGSIYFVPYKDRESDMYIEYTYDGFSDLLNSHVIHLQLYEGDCTLIVNNSKFEHRLLSGFPYISRNNREIAVFDNDESESYYISIIDIDTQHLKHKLTLWSEQFNVENLVWNEQNDLLLKITTDSVGISSYAKIKAGFKPVR